MILNMLLFCLFILFDCISYFHCNMYVFQSKVDI